MALHKMGLGAEFTLNVNPAVKSANQARKSIGKLKQGMTQLALAATPVAVGFGFAFKEAARYEQQLSAVQAVSNATAGEMRKLSKQARMLALDTKFSHTEAAEGMEILTRAGFDQKEMMTALRPVMDAAAADGIELGSAADIVASSIRSMGLSATDAAMVADTLAKASSKSNTNVTFLGESMRYAAAQAKVAGVDFTTTVAALGALGDSGLKGSIAGTSFANMLKKMGKTSRLGKKLLKQHNVEFKLFKDGNLDVINTMKQFGPVLKGMHSSLDKSAFIAEVFGIRGQKAVNAIVQSIEKGRFEKLHQELVNSEGAAKRMAEIRLDNVLGQWTKLRKAFGVASTQLLNGLFKPLKDVFKSMHHGLSQILKASVDLEEAVTDFDEQKIIRKYGIFGEIALGIRDAAEAIKDAFVTVSNIVKDVGNMMGKTFGGDGLRSLTKNVILFNALLAVLVPVGLAVTGLSMAFGGLGSIMSGLGITALIGRLKALIATLIAARVAAGGAGSTAGTAAASGGMASLAMGHPAAAKKKKATFAQRVAAKDTAQRTASANRASKFKGRAKAFGGGLKKVGKGIGAGAVGALAFLRGKTTVAVLAKVGGWLAKIPALAVAAGLAIKVGLVAAFSAFIPIIVVVTGIIAAIMLAIAALGRTGKSVGQTLKETWESVTRPFKQFWKGIKEGLIPALEILKETWTTAIDEIRIALAPLKKAWDDMTAGLGSDGIEWKQVGVVVVGALTSIITAVTKVAGKVAALFGGMISGMRLTGNVIKEVVKGIGNKFDFSGVTRVINEHKQAKEDERIAQQLLKNQKTAEDEKERHARKMWAEYNKPIEGQQQSMNKKLEDIANNTAADRETTVCVDGKGLGKATSKHKRYDNERGGGNATAWQRQVMHEQGSV